jgi:glycosyltransferase involved in cell wall biosynthesis
LPKTRLLDLTRLVSRFGKGPPTGIDRVEQAYLQAFLADPAPVFGLVRTVLGYLLLDRVGLTRIRDADLDLSKPDLIGRIAWRKDPPRGRAEAALRRLAIARCRRSALGKMLRERVPPDADYFNVGHTNLSEDGQTQIKAALRRIVVLVHDTIPLDHPDYARPDTLAGFRSKMQAVSRHADLIVHTTQDSRAKTEAQFARLGRVPPGVVANLGVTPAQPQPLGFTPKEPYFLCLGTIEPRKNHALLLDIWPELPDPKPHLYIVGSRGWAGEALMARLESQAAEGYVHVLSGMEDGGVITLMQGARALLFPSLAEGFGIPALEAAAVGTPLILSDLAVFRELLGDNAIYLEPEARYPWMETIARLATQSRQRVSVMPPPSWAAHFNQVFTMLA